MGNIKTARSRYASRTLGDLQISGSILVYGQAWNANIGTGRDRYVTSGEMAAAAGATFPGGNPGNVQFNVAGTSFGGEDAYRWNSSADTLTVSGATWLDGRTLLQGPVQISGGPLRVYGGAQFGDTASQGGTRITTDGDVQVSGETVFYEAIAGAKTVIKRTGTAVSHLKLQNPNNAAADRWWIGFNHGSTDSDANERARIGAEIGNSGQGRILAWTGFQNQITPQFTIDEFGNLLLGYASLVYATASGMLMTRGGVYAFGPSQLLGDVQTSGVVNVYSTLRVRPAKDDFHGFTAFPEGSAGGLTTYTYGSGYYQGSAFHYRIQNSPSRDQWVDLPVIFDGGVQISGEPLVAYRPLYATNQAAASRYVTSGELSAAGATAPASPLGSVQFNNAGSFGGDPDLRWDTTAMTLTVSGGGLRVESPAIFRAGATVQASGTVVAYDRVQIGRTSLNDVVVNALSRGQVFGGHGADSTGWGWTLAGSGVVRGHVQFVSLDNIVGIPFDHASFNLPVVFHARAPIQISGSLGGTSPGILTYRPIYASPEGSGTRYVTSGELSAIFAGPISISGGGLTYRPIYASPQGGATRYVTSGELLPPGGVDGDVQFNDASSLGGENRLRWTGSHLRVSGFLTVENSAFLDAIAHVGQNTVAGDIAYFKVGHDDEVGVRQQVLWGNSQVGFWDYELNGSGILRGPLTLAARGSAKELVSVQLPMVLTSTSSLQLSGGTVAYRPIYATNQTAASRYVTSGELSAAGATTPATPFGSVQFNNAGAFGADPDLRWDSTAMTLTVSGGGLRVESPAVFRPGAGVQISGASVVAYSDVQIGRASSTALLVDASSRGQTLLGHSAPAATLGYGWGLSGSGILRGQILLAKLDPGDRVLVTMPVQLSAFSSLQLSGVTIAYQPIYATDQTAAGRYVTSGELGAAAPSSPANSVQFNNAGAFGGEIALRWDASADVLTVSGVIDTPGKVEITGRGGYGARFKTPEYDAGGDGYMAYVAGSGIYAGFEYHQALYGGDRIDNEINVFNILGTQLSGMTRQYAPIRFGNTASLGGTQISAQGDLQVSGALRVYPSDVHVIQALNANLDRGVWFSTAAGNGFFGAYHNVLLGSGLIGGGQLVFSNVGVPGASVLFTTMPTYFDDTSGVQLSGGTVAYRPIYATNQTGPGRYVTSGELHPVISTLYTTGTEVYAAGYTRSNLMVSTTLASSMLWPENGIEFDVLGQMSPGNNSLLNVGAVIVHLGGQLLISGAGVLSSGMHAVRTRGTVYALNQNGRQACEVTTGWWGPGATAASGQVMTTTGPTSPRASTNHYLTISPTANPALEVSYILISGGLGVYQTFGRTVYARVNRLPTR